jgi:hypothetical protein
LPRRLRERGTETAIRGPPEDLGPILDQQDEDWPEPPPSAE